MSVPDTAVAGLLQAISDHLSPSWEQRDIFGEGAYTTAAADVRLAIAVVLGHIDEGTLARFAALLNGDPDPLGMDGTTGWANACGGGRCCADWGEGKRCQHCTLAAGHDGNHIDGIGHAWAGPVTHAAPIVPAEVA